MPGDLLAEHPELSDGLSGGPGLSGGAGELVAQASAVATRACTVARR